MQYYVDTENEQNDELNAEEVSIKLLNEVHSFETEIEKDEERVQDDEDDHEDVVAFTFEGHSQLHSLSFYLFFFEVLFVHHQIGLLNDDRLLSLQLYIYFRIVCLYLSREHFS